jgi:hypothetical protein
MILSLTGELAAQTSSLITDEINSAVLGRVWKFKVYLPSDYESSNLRYPVLYLLHSDDGDEDSWAEEFNIQVTMDSLIAAGKFPACIAVMPASGTSWWVDAIEPFETALVSDLIPAIDAEYRTLAERDGRGLVGYKMGGYGAIRYALIHPQLFRAAALLNAEVYEGLPPPTGSSAQTSGAFGERRFEQDTWFALNYPESIRSHLQQPLTTPVYVTAGDDEPNHPSGYEYNVEQQSVILFGHLNKAAGRPGELRIVQGAWDDVKIKMFDAGVQFLFQFLKAPTP